MPNLEPLAILQTGPRQWNAWRTRNPSIRPDLSGAAIVGEIGVDDPYDIYLQGADFQEAKLEGTVWEDAILWRMSTLRHKASLTSQTRLPKADIRPFPCAMSTLGPLRILTRRESPAAGAVRA